MLFISTTLLGIYYLFIDSVDYLQYHKRDLIDTIAIKLTLSVAHHGTKVVIKSIQYIHTYLYYEVTDII